MKFWFISASPFGLTNIFNHRKFAVLLLIGASFASAQDVTLNCVFNLNWLNEYQCTLIDIEVLDPTANVSVTGVHLEGRNNSGVEVVRIERSNTTFIIRQLFETFPNMLEIAILNTNLETIRIPDSDHLQTIYITGTNVRRLDSDSFGNLPRLIFLRLHQNPIEEIDDDALVRLGSITYLGFINNNIRQINSRTFRSLVNLNTLDLERNSLTSIGDDVFASNQALRSLYLEFNQISAISPTFSRNLRSSLVYVNLSGNQCATRIFSLYDDFDWTIFNTVMQDCFRNFVGHDQPQRVSFEFVGTLTIVDQFGNVVATI